LVLATVKGWPDSTFRELAAHCGMEPHEVARRLSDLEKKYLSIYKSGTRDGMTTWKATAEEEAK
jgi:hypothetical protein